VVLFQHQQSPLNLITHPSIYPSQPKMPCRLAFSAIANPFHQKTYGLQLRRITPFDFIFIITSTVAPTKKSNASRQDTPIPISSCSITTFASFIHSAASHSISFLRILFYHTVVFAFNNTFFLAQVLNMMIYAFK